jgi:hypothetical protein
VKLLNNLSAASMNLLGILSQLFHINVITTTAQRLPIR